MDNSVFRIVILAHVASTLFMTGLIWFVQIVHYPLFALTGRQEFQTYEGRHTSLTTWVVAPPMLIEAATGVALLCFSAAGLSASKLWLGLGLLAFIWLSTAILQVPCHNILAGGFDATVHRRLVTTNWGRTLAWSLRAALALWMLSELISGK